MSKGVELQTLPISAALVECLDANGKMVIDAHASGFLRLEDADVYLYTCWHVVTGYGDPWNLSLQKRSERRQLKISTWSMQRGPSGDPMTGVRTCVIPLFDAQGMPLWLQDEESDDDTLLAKERIAVPKHHDVVKIKLPIPASCFSELQLIRSDREIPDARVVIGDRVFISGFPHGFSVGGIFNPIAVVLTRFIASQRHSVSPCVYFIDGTGAPGMSGAPVFIEHPEGVRLFGVYTGKRFTKSGAHTSSGGDQLGIVTDIMEILWGTKKLVNHRLTSRSEAAEAE